MTTTDDAAADERISELDALRGFALCGILVVNVYQQLLVVRHGVTGYPLAVEVLFYERFLPIFAVLFGVGFGIFLRRARSRTARPRLVLARRLAALLVIGAAHFVFHRGEVLSTYALAGLLVLLPASLLPGAAALGLAVVLLLVGTQIVIGYGMIPGLLVLGYALAALGAPGALARRTGRVAVGAAVFGVVGLGWSVAVVRDVHVPRVNVLGGLGGGVGLLPAFGAIAVSLAYCCFFLLLLRTPLGPRLSALLAPMGRMALTNYLAATVLFLVVGPVLRIDSRADAPQIAVLTVGILLAQLAWSPAWLRRFRYGPAEWLWRCVTWWRRTPFRRTEASRPPGAARPEAARSEASRSPAGHGGGVPSGPPERA